LRKILFVEKFLIIFGKPGMCSTHAVVAEKYTGPEAMSGEVVIL